VLTIYTYVSPIDTCEPVAEEIRRGPEGWPHFAVVPMRPSSHTLEVRWYLDRAPAVTEAPPEENGADPRDGFLTEDEQRMLERLRRARGETGEAPPPPPAQVPFKPGLRRRWLGTANEPRPPGNEIRVRRRRNDAGRQEVQALLPPLAPGRYVLTAVVRDPAKPRGERYPWVLKDDRGLLEDRRVWVLEVPESE
jgi:hypothetical protein